MYRTNHYDLIISKFSFVVAKEEGLVRPGVPLSEYNKLKNEYEHIKNVLKQKEDEPQSKSVTANISKNIDIKHVEDTEKDTQVSEFLSCLSQISLDENKCKICGFTFITKSVLLTHMEIHTDDADWSCNKCDYQVNNSKDFKNHVICRHLKTAEKNKIVSNMTF